MTGLAPKGECPETTEKVANGTILGAWWIYSYYKSPPKLEGGQVLPYNNLWSMWYQQNIPFLFRKRIFYGIF